MGILNVHYAIGTLVVALAFVAIFWAPARRYALYALVVQILLGAAVWGTTHVAPPWPHWVLALVTGGIYAMATAFERRRRPRPLVLGIVVLAFVVLAFVYQLGQHAVAVQRVLSPAAT